MKKILCFAILPLLAFAQFQFIPISADYASFYSTDTTAYIEIYVSLFQGNLHYEKSESGEYVASFQSNVELKQNDEKIKTLSHSYQNTSMDTASLKKYNQFVDIFTAEIPYGTYSAKIQIVDNSSQLKGEYILDIATIRPKETVFLSDIELCSQITRDTTKSMFYKNQLKVVPNPRKVFDILQPMLYYYVEINNLPFTQTEKHFYEFDYFITTNDGDTVKSKKPVKKEIIGNTLVEAGALNVMALPQNSYFINARVKDLTNDYTATNRQMFYVYKPSKKDTITSESKLQPIAEVYISSSKDDLKNEFKMIRYIASRDEEKVFKNLENSEAMKKFLTEFWRTRDRKTNLVIGMSRANYFRSIQYANSNFGSMSKPGWKSDRGRILLIYGEPDEYERFPSSMDILPYVVWRYHNLEGGQIFVFTDLDGFGEYQLIHSSYRKELQNWQWQEMISKGGKSSTSQF